MNLRTVVTPGSPASLLTRARRARDRDWLAAGRHVDVLVVGGGIVGVGVALDAVSRGLSVALVERHDLAFGTSRWSSKLAHGGLRYLAQRQIGVAWESAVERDILATRVAPHLVRPIAQLLPLTAALSQQEALLMQVGLLGGDALRRSAGTPSTLLPAPRRIDAAAALRLVPTLDQRELRGGFLSYDCALEDDARLVVAVARTAAALGARIVTRADVTELSVGGARVTDGLDGGTFSINATWVVNATGAAAGLLDPSVQLRPSRGSHAVLRAEALGHPTAAITVPVPGHFGRFVFAVPQPDGWVLAGITDEPVNEAPEVPQPAATEIEWILSTLSTALDRELTTPDVIGQFAGIRPLVDSPDVSSSSADISRRHLVRQHESGVITVTGGKLTTYRRMAQDTVDLITTTPCATTALPLVGAATNASRTQRFDRRFGSEAASLSQLATSDALLAEPVVPGAPVTGAEVAWAVLAEGALDAADVIERRTRLSLVDAWGIAARERVAEIVERFTPNAT